MAKGNKKSQGKKRRIRRKDVVGEMAITTSATEEILDITEEEETLVRIVGNICVSRSLASANNGNILVVLKRTIHGDDMQAISAPGSKVTYEGRASQQLLWGNALALMDQYGNINLDVDVKGMRLMEEFDTVELHVISDISSFGKLAYKLALFYKKA